MIMCSTRIRQHLYHTPSHTVSIRLHEIATLMRSNEITSLITDLFGLSDSTMHIAKDMPSTYSSSH